MLFKLLRAAYGPKFNAFLSKSDDPKSIAQGTETAIRTWAVILHNFDSDLIARAMMIAGDTYSEWPPTAYQFRDLCKGIQKKNSERQKAARFSKERALRPPIDFASAKENLQVIRQMLKGCEA